MAMYADIAIVLILVIMLALGVKRGLLAGIAGVVSVVAAFLGASVAAEKLSPAAEEWLHPLLVKRIEQKLQGAQAADGKTMLQRLDFGGKALTDMLDSVKARIAETGETLLEAVAGNVAHSMAYALVYVVTFAILLAVFLLLTRALKKTELPVLSQLDSICGGVLGLVEGAILVFVLVWALTRLQWLITPEMIEDSVVLKFFTENTPLSLIEKL